MIFLFRIVSWSHFCEIKSKLSCRLFVEDRLCLSSKSRLATTFHWKRRKKHFTLNLAAVFHQPHIQPAELNMLQNSKLYYWEYSQTAMSKCLQSTRVCLAKKCNYDITRHITTQHTDIYSFSASDCYRHEHFYEIITTYNPSAVCFSAGVI